MKKPRSTSKRGATPVAGQCAIDIYHRRAEVEAGILSGMTHRSIEFRERAIDIKAPSRIVIAKHASSCMPKAIRAAEEARVATRIAVVQSVAATATERLDAVKPLSAFSDRIEALLVPIEKLISACDEWLTHPTDKAKYDLNPRTHEVDISYEEKIGELSVRKTDKLSVLIRRIEEKLGVVVIKGETNTADPRKLILDAARSGRESLELIAKIVGILKPEKTELSLSVFLGSPEWTSTQALLVEAVKDHPEAAERVARALEAVGKGGGR